MRILIDLQGAQTSGSRHRGIGRYSLSLTEAILAERGEHDVQILLNGAFPDSIADIRNRLAGILDLSCFHIFWPVGETHQSNFANSARRQASELIREAAVASLQPDVVHITSHFEGFGDQAITSLKRMNSNAIHSVTLYDLIPHIHRQVYLQNPEISRWYSERLAQLRRADLLLAISGSSAAEAVEHLGFPETSVVNVGTAADPHFLPSKVSKERAALLRSKYRLGARFVMYTGGIDYRKNIERLIGAFAKLGAAREGVSLAIVCSCSELDRQRLEAISEQAGLSRADVSLTGFVPEDHLVDLYSLCELFVFPSWHEGFGLPALEAMHCGAPVIGADLSSLPEVIGSAEALFDPFDEDAMSAKIERALTSKAFRSKLLKNSRNQAKAFSWNLTAQKAVAAFERAWDQRQAPSFAGAISARPRLAFVSPIPPARSGIADYSAELLPELSRHYEIDLIVPTREHVEAADTLLKNEFCIRDAESFIASSEAYDRVLYHFGNSDHHGYMVELIRQIPGVVVLHDFYLSGLLAWMEHARALGPVLTNALFDSHGFQPLIEFAGKMPLEDIMWRYPASAPIVERALGIIVHSEFSKRLANDWFGPDAARDWTVIPLLRARPQSQDRSAARAKVGAGEQFLICSFGALGETKQSDRLLDCFLNTNAYRSGRAKLVFVGAMPANEFGERLTGRLEQLARPDSVSVTGWATPELYETYLEAGDLAIQLRTLSRGETSAAVLDCLNFGIPTVVNANGSMADLPKHALVMLSDEFHDVELSCAIDRLVGNEELRANLGSRARSFIKDNHDPRRCSEKYYRAIEEAYENSAASPLVVASNMRSSIIGLDLDDQCEAAKLLEPLFGARISRPIYLDIAGIEAQLTPDRIDEAIRIAAAPLLEARSRFEVVSLTDEGNFSTRRARALRAFAASAKKISLEEHVGRLASHDEVKLLVLDEPGERVLRTLSDMFVKFEIVIAKQPAPEKAHAISELQ